MLPLEDRSSRVGTAFALDAKRDGGAEGRAAETIGDVMPVVRRELRRVRGIHIPYIYIYIYYII